MAGGTDHLTDRSIQVLKAYWLNGGTARGLAEVGGNQADLRVGASSSRAFFKGKFPLKMEKMVSVLIQ